MIPSLPVLYAMRSPETRSIADIWRGLGCIDMLGREYDVCEGDKGFGGRG